MSAHECSTRMLLDRSTLIKAESWNLTDRHAADVVCFRKPFRKGTRQSKKLKSSLDDECGVDDIICDTWLFLESLNMTREYCAVDVVRIRKPSRKSSRNSPKLESLLHDTHRFRRLSDKALHTHATATFHKTHTRVTTSCTDGNGHCNFKFDAGWLSDNASDMSTRPLSSTEALLHAFSVASFKDWDRLTKFVLPLGRYTVIVGILIKGHLKINTAKEAPSLWQHHI